MTHRLTVPLFGEEAPPERKLASDLARMEGGSAAQRAFHKLVAQVARSREKLEQWQACDERVQQRMTGELGPRMLRMRALQMEMIGRIDALLAGPRGGGGKARSHAARLRAWLRRLVDTLDPEGTDARLEAVRARHQCESPRERDARRRARLLGAIIDAFAPTTGELEQLKTADLHSLLDHAQRCTHEHILQQLPPGVAKAQGQPEKARARREAKRRAKEERAETARTDEAAQAGQSLRDVYRRLAMALHPDREPDPERRKEKTTLIQQVNQAYAAGDLLTLLGIQLDTQAVGGAAPGDLSAQKLDHFSQILRRQLADLEADIESLTRRLGEAANVPSWQNPNRKLIDQAVSLDIAEADRSIKDLEADLARLISSGLSVTRLASLPDGDPGERSVDDELDHIIATIAASVPPAPRRRRR